MQSFVAVCDHAQLSEFCFCLQLHAGHVGQLMGPKGPFTFLKWGNEYGEVYKVQFMDNMAVVLTNADVIARVTKKTGMGWPHA